MRGGVLISPRIYLRYISPPSPPPPITITNAIEYLFIGAAYNGIDSHNIIDICLLTPRERRGIYLPYKQTQQHDGHSLKWCAVVEYIHKQ